MASVSGTPDDPWVLLTPSGGSEFTMHVDADSSPALLICKVGKTRLTYLARALDDLNAFLIERGDWVLLGAADEQRPAMEGTVEAWGRSSSNPVGGWYGQKAGLRGRFGVYVPPVLVAQGRAEIAIENRKARVRAI
jgi:hypothetical protein